MSFLPGYWNCNGANCAILLANLCLYTCENEFVQIMVRSGYRNLSGHLAHATDYLIVSSNKKFSDYLSEIRLPQVMVKKANKSDNLATYLDLTFIIDSGGKLSTRLYNERDDFDFHIVKFIFPSSNIPTGPYCVYRS